MRIATSTVYYQQSQAIDNLESQYQQIGLTLSSGKQLNAPSDDPTQIGADLNIRTTIAIQTQESVNIGAASSQLSSTDNALANLTSVLQSTRSLATRGASDLISAQERKNIGSQVDQYLTQAIALANSQYGGQYLFGGSVQLSQAPLSTTGSPVSGVSFSGNDQSQAPLQFNGQSFPVGPTLQQAFNYDATNGSPSVFQTLINLRDTFNNGNVVDESAQSINHSGGVIYGAASPAVVRTTLGAAPFAVPLKADSNGNYAISINNTDATGVTHVEQYTFNGTTVLDDATATSVTGAINANTATTGLSATFDAASQRLILSNPGGGSFSVTDEPSAGAASASNFIEAFQLQGQATLPGTVSTQLADIDNVINTTLAARSTVGSRINALAQLGGQVNVDVNLNTDQQSSIEDTDVAKASTHFSATQAALNASYSVTSQLESKHLFDYL